MPKYLLEDMMKKPVEQKREVMEKPAKNRSRYLLWLVAFISLIFFVFALSFLFGRAEISVTPKTEEVVLNENLSANLDSNTAVLPFDLVAISGEEEKTVQADMEKNVSDKATGTVIIYNSFGFSPQPLSIDTRLLGSNGKIYKTLTKTIVPGMDKNGVPGQVEVGIYASVAGADYNSAPLDFYILGFKGTAKYSKFKVRSKTGTEIAGGFVGKVSVISEADQASALAELNSSLQTKLLAQAASQIPSGFVLFKNAVFLKAEAPVIPLSADQNNNFTISEKGVLYGIIFDEQKLTQKIAGDNINNYDGSDVYIPNIENLAFSLSNQDNISFDNLQNINFNLSGPAQIVWKLDVNKFTADLLGKSKKDFNQTLLQYPNIDSATLTLSPIWEISIPNKIKNVKVIVNYPK